MAETHPLHRHLSAVLIADMAGYTAMIEADTDATLTAWREAREQVIRPRIEAADGRLVKFTGDGFLAEFSSVERAIAVAIDIQTELADSPLGFRIGLSVGDVIEQDGDIFGESINVAARLEKLADPGGIAISGSVHEAVRNHIDVRFTDCGTHEVKNVSTPVRVWRWSPKGLSASLASTTALSADATPPAILVEPLKPAGEIDRAEEFAEEVLDELVLSLSRRSGARIVTGQVPAEDLRYRVTGRCRVRGDRIRVQLNLIFAATGQTVWSRRFDGAMESDAFLQDLIRAANGELRVMLNAYDGSDIAATPDEDLDVKGLLAKAAFLFYRHDPLSTKLSYATMRRAAELAPNNAMVVSMLAWSQAHMVPYLEEYVEDIDVDQVMMLADKAVDLNPHLDFAFHCRAWMRLWLKADHAGAMADMRRVMAVNPDYHKGPQDEGVIEIFAGHPEAGIERLNETIAATPSEPVVPLLTALIALGHLLIGDQAAAIRFAEDAYEHRPLLRLHGLMVAAAHADPDARVGGATVTAIVARLHLQAEEVRRLPFANPADAGLIVERLRRAGAGS